MGSKPSKQSGGSEGGGMSPAQSMAMAGNYGLASINEADAIKLQKAIKNVNKATGGNQGSSFTDIGKNIGEVGSKYQRPADVASYIDKMSTISDAIDQGATVFTGPDGIQRVNFNNLGIKDDQGRTILSRQIPGLTATAPSLGQLGGDIGRAVTGYNSLQYTDPASNVPEMVRSPGIAEGVAKLAVPGSVAAKIATDLFGTAKNFLFPAQEEEETTVDPRITSGALDAIQKSLEEKPQPQFDPFSSGADATGDAFALTKSAIPGDVEITELTDPLYGSSLYGKPQMPPGFKVMSPAQRDLLDEINAADAFEEAQKEFLRTPGSGYQAGSGLPVEEEPEIIQIPNQPGGGGGGGGGGSQGQGSSSDDDTDPSETELFTRRYLEAAGFSQQEIDNIMAASGYAMGGLIPPESGPQSEGIESLFKNK